MSFTLGSIIVKGGKVISTGFNHQRPRFDDVFGRTTDRPVSMHAEMHAIFNLTGCRAPPTKQHVQGNKETVFPPKPPQRQGYGLRPQPFQGFEIPCLPGTRPDISRTYTSLTFEYEMGQATVYP